MVGVCGPSANEDIILESEDRGTSWAVHRSGTGFDLISIFGTRDGKRVWAVGEYGTIVESYDGGASWGHETVAPK